MNKSNLPKPIEFEAVGEFGSREITRASKVSMLWLVLHLIFVIIFNVFFFVLGNLPHNLSVWMSYSFIHFAYFMLIVTKFLVRKGSSASVFGFALYSISTTYFSVALIAGVVFVLVAPESFIVPLLVQLSCAGLYGITLISHMIANEKTADAEANRQQEIAYVKNATFHLKKVLDKTNDKETRRRVEKVYDVVNSSPIKSYPHLGQLEIRILSLLDELDDAVANGEMPTIISVADALLVAANDRNNRIRNYPR